MSSTLRDVRRTIDQTTEYQNLRRQLDDLPGNIRRYVADNFSGLEGAQLAADLVGMVEPTPFADIAGGIIGAVRGDWVSVGTSVLGIVPYLGDTGKLGKWAVRAATDRRYRHIVNAVNSFTRIKRQIAVLSQTRALRRTRAEMWEYYQRFKRGDNCELCRRAGRSVKLPRHGQWRPGPPGNGKWFPDENSPMTPEMKDLINQKGGVPYTEGMPDYRDFATELPPPGSGQKTLPIEMNGSRRDIDRGFSQYFDMMEANGTALSRAEKRALRDSHTWHHTADGLQLVPRSLHNIPEGGPSHVGARSWLDWPNY